MTEENLDRHDLETRRYKLLLIRDGLIVGLLAGLLAVAYRFTLGQVDQFRNYLFADLSWSHVLIFILLFIPAAWGMDRLLRWAPYSNGSGIPQIRAELNHNIDPAPIPTICSKFLGGLLANISGQFLGREGPSIQLGGMITKIYARLTKRSPLETKHLLSAGASAGLAAAFNAPMSGVLFAMEEMHKSFSPYLLLPCVFSSLAANFISFKILGNEPAFSFPIENRLPLNLLGFAVLLGALGGVLGSIFNTGLGKVTDWLKALPISRFWIFLLLMLAMLPIGYYSTTMLGGGHHLIESLSEASRPLYYLLFALLLRLVFLWLAYGSGAQGGIFLPTLVLGALLGAIVLHSFGIDVAYTHNFLYLGMAAVLSAVVRAPLLSILLISEMSGSVHSFIAMTTTAMVAYVVAEILGTLPIYESLYNRLLKPLPKKVTMHDEPQLERLLVPGDFAYLNAPLKDIPFPSQCIIISIRREHQNILPKAGTTLKAGDDLLLMINEGDIAKIAEFFHQEK